MMDYEEIVGGVMDMTPMTIDTEEQGDPASPFRVQGRCFAGYVFQIRCPRCSRYFEPEGESRCAICEFHDCCGGCCAELHIGDRMRREVEISETSAFLKRLAVKRERWKAATGCRD